MNSSNLIGQTFGKLELVARHLETSNGESKWICRCNCGNPKTRIVRRSNLISGNTKSCGCFQKEATKEANAVHGLATSPEYGIWTNIKTRCYNESTPYYKHYGGRGIGMCDEWYHDFNSFYRDMGTRPSIEHSVDRKDNNKGYSKDNCRWATNVEQANNKLTNVFYENQGRFKTLPAWSRELSLNFNKFKHCVVIKGLTIA